MFNPAKFKGLTRRNSFSSGQSIPIVQSREEGEAEYKNSRETHIIHGNINQIPLSKKIDVASSGNVTIDIVNMKLNENLNSTIIIKFIFIVLFDNTDLTSTSNQSRTCMIKSQNEYLFNYYVHSNSITAINGSNTVTYCNPINSYRNILNPTIQTSIDGLNCVLRLTANLIGSGFLYLNGVIDVIANNSESIINFN